MRNKLIAIKSQHSLWPPICHDGESPSRQMDDEGEYQLFYFKFICQSNRPVLRFSRDMELLHFRKVFFCFYNKTILLCEPKVLYCIEMFPFANQ